MRQGKHKGGRIAAPASSCCSNLPSDEVADGTAAANKPLIGFRTDGRAGKTVFITVEIPMEINHPALPKIAASAPSSDPRASQASSSPPREQTPGPVARPSPVAMHTSGMRARQAALIGAAGSVRDARLAVPTLTEPHAGARRQRFAVAARDILSNPDLQGADLSGKLTTLFGNSEDVGLNLSFVSDPGKLNLLLDALSAQKELRTLQINASNMGPRFQTAIAALLPVIATNPKLKECNIDVRDNDQGVQAAHLITQQLAKYRVAGSATH